MLNKTDLWQVVELTPSLLRDAKRGIERECLRVDQAGQLALTPHPTELGSALTHPSITTDYSEALLEFITKPHDSIDCALNELDDIHQYVAKVLQHNQETLWPASMPCVLNDDNAIPVAEYGSSNSAQLKTTYRIGLGHRYGRQMQTIAGIHYNYSLSPSLISALRAAACSECDLQDFRTELYFGVIRNFRRYFWLLIYLFGASPVVCRSFIESNEHHQLKLLSQCTAGNQTATSLRMGDLGYQSNAQAGLIVDYNDLGEYIRTLTCAINQPHDDYVRYGVEQEDHYAQLSTALLQIENEFYSTIRPKRPSQRGETALHALAEGGVEYIEVRCLDIDPFEKRGISADTCHFVEAFLVWCTLESSPLTESQEYYEVAENQRRVVNFGRELDLKLLRDGDEVAMHVWMEEIFTGIARASALLDKANDSTRYSEAVENAKSKLYNPAATPSSKLESLALNDYQGFSDLAKQLSKQHAKEWLDSNDDEKNTLHFQSLASQSIDEQASVEAADSISFHEYLQDYLSQYKDPELLDVKPRKQ